MEPVRYSSREYARVILKGTEAYFPRSSLSSTFCISRGGTAQYEDRMAVFRLFYLLELIPMLNDALSYC